MLSWQKKSLVVVHVLLSLSTIHLFAWSPLALLDRNLAKHYGAQPASAWYQEKTHEFLNNMGVNDADKVSVRQIALSPYMMQFATTTFLDRLPAITLATGIWFNESSFEKVPEETKLWVIAHEAAHYMHNDGMSNQIMAQMNKLMPAFILTAMTGVTVLGFNWLSHKIGFLESNRSRYQKIVFVAASMYFGSSIMEMVLQINRSYSEVQKLSEREADLAAAKMLCEHGMVNVVEAHIKAVKDAIAKGLFLLIGYNHPSFQEQLDYLQEFWNGYLAQHPEYN